MKDPQPEYRPILTRQIPIRYPVLSNLLQRGIEQVSRGNDTSSPTAVVYVHPDDAVEVLRSLMKTPVEDETTYVIDYAGLRFTLIVTTLDTVPGTLLCAELDPALSVPTAARQAKEVNDRRLKNNDA